MSHCKCITIYYAGTPNTTYCEEHEPYDPGPSYSPEMLRMITERKIEQMAADTFFNGMKEGRKHL